MVSESLIFARDLSCAAVASHYLVDSVSSQLQHELSLPRVIVLLVASVAVNQGSVTLSCLVFVIECIGSHVCLWHALEYAWPDDNPYTLVLHPRTDRTFKLVMSAASIPFISILHSGVASFGPPLLSSTSNILYRIYTDSAKAGRRAVLLAYDAPGLLSNVGRTVHNIVVPYVLWSVEQATQHSCRLLRSAISSVASGSKIALQFSEVALVRARDLGLKIIEHAVAFTWQATDLSQRAVRSAASQAYLSLLVALRSSASSMRNALTLAKHALKIACITSHSYFLTLLRLLVVYAQSGSAFSQHAMRTLGTNVYSFSLVTSQFAMTCSHSTVKAAKLAFSNTSSALTTGANKTWNASLFLSSWLYHAVIRMSAKASKVGSTTISLSSNFLSVGAKNTVQVFSTVLVTLAEISHNLCSAVVRLSGSVASVTLFSVERISSQLYATLVQLFRLMTLCFYYGYKSLASAFLSVGKLSRSTISLRHDLPSSPISNISTTIPSFSPKAVVFFKAFVINFIVLACALFLLRAIVASRRFEKVSLCLNGVIDI
jgi:hypothetical protein